MFTDQDYQNAIQAWYHVSINPSTGQEEVGKSGVWGDP